MTAIGIIPARFASTRFPGKLLAPILGKSLIQRTYENALNCAALSKVVVATDDARILKHVQDFGGEAVMTRSDWISGTDRISEVIAKPGYSNYDIVVNVQGDEPCVDPAIISAMIYKLQEDQEAVVSTPIAKIIEHEDLQNPSIVKCVKNLKDHALYFSRANLPPLAKHSELKTVDHYRHIGLYAFRKSFLSRYVDLKPSPLQMAENLEQLKILENGFQIAVVLVEYSGIDVNEPEDIQKIEKYLCQQNLSS